MVEKVDVPIGRVTMRELTGRFPRVDLGEFPTPLDEAPRFSEAVGGPRIFVKRDDLTGLAFGGNKTRQLEYLLGMAVEEGADTVITGAAAQSNMCRQTTAACAKLGLDVHLVLRKVRGDLDGIRQGNLLLDDLMGANVTLIERDEGVDQRQMILDLAQELRQEGRKVYIPHHFDGYLATISYVDCLLETLEQLEKKGVEANYIYVASGNFTYSGLVFGIKATGAPIEVRGFPAAGVAERAKCFVIQLVNETAERLSLDLSVSLEELYITDDYVGQGYGIPTQKGIAALKLLARTEGILLDPVYTSKAMAGLIDHARSGDLRPEDNVVFLHTGGTPAVFAYADVLGE